MQVKNILHITQARMKQMLNNMQLHEYRLVSILENQLRDYIDKPIPNHILNNTVNKLVSVIQNTASEHIINIENRFYWDSHSKQLFYNHEEINLTKLERKLLSLLFSSLNRGVSYDEIFAYLWQDTHSQKHESLKTIVKQLRKKLPKNIIKNIFNYGYKIDIKRNIR